MSTSRSRMTMLRSGMVWRSHLVPRLRERRLTDASRRRWRGDIALRVLKEGGDDGGAVRMCCDEVDNLRPLLTIGKLAVKLREKDVGRNGASARDEKVEHPLHLGAKFGGVGKDGLESGDNGKMLDTAKATKHRRSHGIQRL